MSDIPPSNRSGAIESHSKRLLGMISVMRLAPFDTTTESGRAQERMRRIALTALAAMAAKFVSVASMLISIPLTLHYLGPERFGMWMVISSFTLLLSFSDLGLGNGVLNAVARANGKDDRRGQQVAISNGYVSLTLVAAVIAGAFAAIQPFVDWGAVFNAVDPAARAEARPAMIIYAVFFVIGVPLALVQRVQAGLQQGFNSSLWQCGSSLLSLVCVLGVIAAQGGLPLLVAAFVGAPQVANLFNTVTLFHRQPDLLPSWGLTNKRDMGRLARTGLLFFVLQAVVAATVGADNIIIAHKLGADAVAGYGVPERLFSIITMVVGMMLSPLWPAYGEALARGDFGWLRKTLIRSTLFAFSLAAASASGLVVLGPAILRLWVGNDLHASFSLLLAFAIWKPIESAGVALSVFLNGTAIIRTQIFVSISFAVLSISLKLILIDSIGVLSIPISMSASYIVAVLLPYGYLIFRGYINVGGRAV